MWLECGPSLTFLFCFIGFETVSIIALAYFSILFVNHLRRCFTGVAGALLSWCHHEQGPAQKTCTAREIDMGKVICSLPPPLPPFLY